MYVELLVGRVVASRMYSPVSCRAKNKERAGEGNLVAEGILKEWQVGNTKTYVFCTGISLVERHD